MSILLNGIDERLIHGQILSSWIRKYRVELLVVLDDSLADDPFAQSVFTMAMSKDVDVLFMALQPGIRWLQEHMADQMRTMVLFRNLSSFHRAFHLGYTAEALNIGSMIAGPHRKRLTIDVFATAEEIQMMKELLISGVSIQMQVVETETRTDVAELLSELEQGGGAR